MILRETKPDNDLFICVQGKARAVKEEQVLAAFGPGDFFGEMAMIDKQPRFASVVAVERTRVIAFDREALFAQLNASSRLAVKFLWPLCRDLNDRLRATTTAYLETNQEEHWDY